MAGCEKGFFSTLLGYLFWSLYGVSEMNSFWTVLAPSVSLCGTKYKQGVVLTTRNRTDPPCSVGHPIAHRQRYRRRQTTANKNNTGPLGGPVTNVVLYCIALYRILSYPILSYCIATNRETWAKHLDRRQTKYLLKYTSSSIHWRYND